MKVKVVTDSGGGLTKKEADEMNIGFLPLQIIIEDKTYLDGMDIDVHELYDWLEKGYFAQTSMPPLGMIEELFDSYKEEGITDVILITVSNGLSGTNEAIHASAKWHGMKVHTLDIFTTVGLERYLALAANALVQKGYHPERIIHLIKDAINHSAGYFICEDLTHLARSGRLTPVAARLAGMLKIKPILTLSAKTEGKVGLFEKVRTMHKAITKACKQVQKDVKDLDEYVLITLDSQAPEYAEILRQEITSLVGKDVEMLHMPIAAVIAAHAGLGVVGVQYIKKIKGVDNIE